jgi:glycosyltransferase involved in cell wall biosynthesis
MMSGLPAYLVSKQLRIPLVGGIFNDFLGDPAWTQGPARRRIRERVGRFVLARSALARCDSRETTDALRRMGYTQVRYVPFFVPWLERFAVSDEVIQERARRWQDDPVILCVARLAEEKNVALLLRAFAQPGEGRRRGRLVIVGSGPLADELRRLAVDLGVDDRVHWVGAVGYHELPRFFREANLFVLSSDSETSARVLTLAQAARLPTVTTRTSGSTRIVHDGLTGFIVPIGDVEALAGCLSTLLTDEGEYRRLLESDAYRAGAEYGEAAITGPLRSFYAEVAGAVDAG